MTAGHPKSFRRQCFYVWSRIEEGRLVCSVGADSSDPEFEAAATAQTSTEDFIDLEISFDLSDVLGSLIESHELGGGSINVKALPTFRAIETELKAMLTKIATLRFQEVQP